MSIPEGYELEQELNIIPIPKGIKKRLEIAARIIEKIFAILIFTSSSDIEISIKDIFGSFITIDSRYFEIICG